MNEIPATNDVSSLTETRTEEVMLVTLDSFRTETSKSSSALSASSPSFALDGLNLFFGESLTGLILGTILTVCSVAEVSLVVEGGLVDVTGLVTSLNVFLSFLLMKELNLLRLFKSLLFSLCRLPGRPVLYLLGFLLLV